MYRDLPNQDLLTECYAALATEPDADTCCKRIFVLIERMRNNVDASRSEEYVILLLNQLMKSTEFSFNIHIINLSQALDDKKYSSALQITRAMIHHEAMLHQIASGAFAQSVPIYN